MMRIRSVPPLLAFLALLAGPATLLGASDPGDLYLQAFQSYKTAEREESAGHAADALQKYRFCVSVLQQIQKANPDYEPLVVDFRLKKSRESIARVQSLQAGSTFLPDSAQPATAIPPTPPPPLRSLPDSPLRLPELPTAYRVPIPSSRGNGIALPRATPRSDLFEGAGEIMERGAIQGLKDRIRELQLRLNQEKQNSADLQEKLLDSTAREQSARTEVDRWRVQAVEQKSQLDQAQQALGDLQRTNDQLVGEKGSDAKRIAGLESDLEAARADLEVANEYSGELFAKLEKAAQFIDASEKIRKQLLAERQNLSDRVNAKGAGDNGLRRKRDAVTAENESLREKIEKAADQNKELAAKLTAAELKLAGTAKSRDEREQVERGLKEEVASMSKTLASMRDQLSAGAKRIAELEKQLADTSSATMTASGAMAEENALLKSLVARQINEQAKRQQARRLVQEEMEKLQVRSTTLGEKLDALGRAETDLTPQEKRLFDRPAAGMEADADFSISIAEKEPASDLPEDLQLRAKEANELSSQNRFAEARAIYDEIARKAPKSYIAAINLGITERQLGQNAEAIAAFKRALEIRSDDAYALTNLGKTELNSGDLKAATSTLSKAADADSTSHYVHYLLAMALHQDGKQEDAQREVMRALDLNPDYGPAKQLKNELERPGSDGSASSEVLRPQ